MGISAGSLSDCLQTDIVSGKYRLLYASAKEALAKSFLEALKRERNTPWRLGLEKGKQLENDLFI